MDPKGWVKLKKPVLRSNEEMELYAPGHASFVKSPDGTEDWIVYHSAKRDSSGWDRNGRMQKITWVNDTPTVPEGMIYNDEIIPLPSGEKAERMLIQLEDGVLSEGVERLDGLTTSSVLTFPTLEEQAVITCNVPRDGVYAVYVRYNNPTETNSSIRVRLNDAASAVLLTARLTGGEKQFVISPLLFGMKAGVNTLTFTAQPGIALDLIVVGQISEAK